MPHRPEVVIEEHITEDTSIEALGKSYDSAFNRKLDNSMLIGEPEQETLRERGDYDTLEYNYAMSQRELTEKMEGSASGKANFGLVKAKASARMKQFFSSNDYSCYIFARRTIVRPRRFLRLESTSIVPQVMAFIKENRDSPNLIEREFGDEVITGASIGAEVLVKMEVQTSSETQQKEFQGKISAAYAKASGKASLSTYASLVESSKQLSFMAMGTIPGVIQGVSTEAAERLILDFSTDSIEEYSIRDYQTSLLTAHPDLTGYRIFNARDLDERQAFLARADSLYQNHVEWENNIKYVLAEGNKGEFSSAMIADAAAHSQECKSRMDALDRLVNATWAEWRETGENQNLFKMDRLDPYSEFWSYKRVVEPATPASTPSSTRAEPKKEFLYRGDKGHGGGGGRN